MKFEIGEIAIYNPSGANCEIKSVPGHDAQYFRDSEYILSIDGDVNPSPLSNGGLWSAPEYMLSKKPPEASWEEIQSWAKWNPTKQGVEV